MNGEKKDMADACSKVGNNAVQVVAETSKPITPKKVKPVAGNGSTPDPLPDIKSARSLIESKLALPAQVVHGLLHRGSKMVLGGGSKSYKTWVLQDLALSVANGLLWWGMKTNKGRVLYINFEIQEGFFAARLNQIAKAKVLDTVGFDDLDVWTLRGYCADLAELMPTIIERVKTRTYDLIIVDPIYKGMGARDENKAGDINSMLNEIERLAVESGAAVAFGAHFSKGNQAAKESIDRISGSGVFARDPDSILVMTKHENADTYTIEATLRNFKPIEPFCVRWAFPLMVPDANLDPDKLKTPGNKIKKFIAHDLIKALGYQKLMTKEWETKARTETGMGERTFAKLKKEILEAEQPEVVKVEDNQWAVARNLSLDDRQAQHKSKHEEAGAEVQ